MGKGAGSWPRKSRLIHEHKISVHMGRRERGTGVNSLKAGGGGEGKEGQCFAISERTVNAHTLHPHTFSRV